jgi:hypothetical protein
VSQSALSSRLNVDTLAHQIGQWVRDAQVSSMGVRRSSAGVYTSGYGLHFDIATPTQFVYFADVNNDGVYTPLSATPDIAEQTIDLLQGYSITLLCGAHAGVAVATTCGGVAGAAATNVLDISFRRPNPDANMKGDTIGTTPASNVYSPARITVTSPRGLTRTVVVWVTGQVSIR